MLGSRRIFVEVLAIAVNTANSVFCVTECRPPSTDRRADAGRAVPAREYSVTHEYPPSSSETGQSVPEALAFWAAQTPDAIALLAPGREPATYQELHEAVDRLAEELGALGLRRHDGIALLLPEGPELCVLLLATIAVGIAVPLAWPHPEAAHARILSNPRVRALVVSPETARSLPERPDPGLSVLTAIPGPSDRIGDLRLDGDAWADAAEVMRPTLDDVALILHSSGPPGDPSWCRGRITTSF